MKNNYVVFKISDKLKPKLENFYKPFMCEKKPPYSVFQAKNYDVTITLYESGKVMFQGIGADLEAMIWIETEKKLNPNVDVSSPETKKEEKKKENDIFFNTSTIGSDETGCGDFFGPIVVCASYVSKENISYLKSLGVRDSKQVTDDKIIKIAPEIMKNIPYVCYTLNNKDYNTTYKGFNMVQIKCILHNKALVSLIQKYNPTYEIAIIDQFVNEKKYYSYLSNAKEKLTNIKFYTKAENKCMAVAAASIIARYVFLKEMEKLNEYTGINLAKGASEKVDNQLKELLKTHDEKYLLDIAKLDFKTYQKNIN